MMSVQEKNASQKSGRGRPATGRGQTIGVRMHDEMLKRVDAWIETQSDPKPTRPEAIRVLVARGFVSDHYGELIDKALKIIADLAREEDKTPALGVRVLEILGGYKSRAIDTKELEALTRAVTNAD